MFYDKVRQHTELSIKTKGIRFIHLPPWFSDASTYKMEIEVKNDRITVLRGDWLYGDFGSPHEKRGVWKSDGVFRGREFYGMFEAGIFKGEHFTGYFGTEGKKYIDKPPFVEEDAYWCIASHWDKNATFFSGWIVTGACKHPVAYHIQTKLIRIGCEIRSINDWDQFFDGGEYIFTPRNTEEFEQIQKSYQLAKIALEMNVYPQPYKY